MKLALHVRYDETNTDICLDDPRLSTKHWIIGNAVCITVGPRNYLHSKTDFFIVDTEPYMNIHGGVGRFHMGSDRFDIAKFEVAMKEAREYAEQMCAAVREHIGKLSTSWRKS